MWAKGKTMKGAIIIGKEEGDLYKLKGHSEAVVTHVIKNPCEIWHRSYPTSTTRHYRM
jgi:hypothetical protein